MMVQNWNRQKNLRQRQHINTLDEDLESLVYHIDHDLLFAENTDKIIVNR